MIRKIYYSVNGKNVSRQYFCLLKKQYSAQVESIYLANTIHHKILVELKNKTK